ncbi:MAG: Carbonic anhydrase/acetyltransferase isoleucine patch superfamily-like protein [Planctomycetaceae bacterium]|nr:Carbonic anhydrase/acetyltransferase isoleucine patch superfamily-like protein [Planctomycetaceae bacterium]
MSPQDFDNWPLLVDALPEPPAGLDPAAHLDWRALWCAPQIDPTAWVAQNAVVMGRVRLKARSSVWYNCTIRGDGDYIEVGEDTNVQDGSILHVDFGYPCILGNRVTLGHGAIVHASIVEDDALIGISATVLSRCVIGAGALIAAGAVVMEGTIVPPGTLWAGCPAKNFRVLTVEQRARLQHTWQHYVANGQACLSRFGREHIDALSGLR